jgi:hypothetical protein
MNDGRPEEPSVKAGVKLSKGPLDGVEADSAPDGAAVKNVPLTVHIVSDPEASGIKAVLTNWTAEK